MYLAKDNTSTSMPHLPLFLLLNYQRPSIRLSVCALLFGTFDLLPVTGIFVCVCNQGVHVDNFVEAVDQRLIVELFYSSSEGCIAVCTDHYHR